MQTTRKPDWLKIRPPNSPHYQKIKDIVKEHKLNTVCAESHCPNISECWSGGTATFMILGEVCTRGCKFCNVKTGYTQKAPDQKEIENVVEAVKKMRLDYVVLTSVDRDDLEDGGSRHFAQCIRSIKEHYPEVRVEVLIPDFRGNEEQIKNVVEAKPDVIAHNIETVKRLQKEVRDHRAGYTQSLEVLEKVKKLNPETYTKSSLMVGLGEREEEVLEAFKDLRRACVDIVTLGQYLRPSAWHLEVKAYVEPKQFKHYEEEARKEGFLYAASGPFVRSSYKAGELFLKRKLANL